MNRRALLVAASAVVAVGLAAPVQADDPDSSFADLLDQHGALFNFRLQKWQGQRACDDLQSGRAWNGKAAVRDLQSEGGYTYDVALQIVSAAITVYCPNVNY
ncbi:hypothetical protein A5658_22020 [Mycobacterium sp. 1245111.1]|uniref:DUF732 domain-containing protein n=1 Tax=Mycobacterium sp. 1245111.1 TaxID=1834073 RepID=UPI0007FD07E0|nr:DUF732 domain-containing protein [Mycobacterium sp. 1245111.1]OBK40313.1 hypothetical protein A5658_22020 [Mycobacterium sp. 1245111.1]